MNALGRMQAMKETVRDRILLVVIAAVVVLGTLLVGYASDLIGLGTVGLLVAIETVFVFGAVLSYCRTSWPKWYLRPRKRTVILRTYFILLTTHFVTAGLAFRRLRFEWGMLAWIGISFAELLGVVLILEVVVRYAKVRQTPVG